MVSKNEHILRLLTKLKHKKYEHFVVSRIVHKLIDTDIKFTCQQYVQRPNGYALLDMFFPQLNVSLEIDEPQHETEYRARLDVERSRDIISATGIYEKRIKVETSRKSIKPLAELAAETDKFTGLLLELAAEKRKCSDWQAWDFDEEYKAISHLRRGYIDAQENVLLKRHIDVIQLFGRELKGHQSGGWIPPSGFGVDMVWFPRLYPNGKWDNSLSYDGTEITERNLDDRGAAIHDQTAYGKRHLRAVFAHKNEPLTGTLYRFVGVFQYNHKLSSEREAAIYCKVRDRINLKV